MFCLTMLDTLKRIDSRQPNRRNFKRRVLIDSKLHQFSKSGLSRFQVNADLQVLGLPILKPAIDLVTFVVDCSHRVLEREAVEWMFE